MVIKIVPGSSRSSLREPLTAARVKSAFFADSSGYFWRRLRRYAAPRFTVAASRSRVLPLIRWRLVTMTGDSMVDAGIMDGDIVALVRKDPKLGDIVAALCDDTSVTLKRLVKERGRLILRAANPKYDDIKPKKIESQGVMVGLIRRKIF